MRGRSINIEIKQTLVSLASTREEAQKLTELKWFTKEHIFGEVVSEGDFTYFNISHNWKRGRGYILIYLYILNFCAKFLDLFLEF